MRAEGIVAAGDGFYPIHMDQWPVSLFPERRDLPGNSLHLGVAAGNPVERTNYAGALFGLIGCAAITVAVAVGGPRIGLDPHWLYLAAITQAIIMSGIAVVSLLTPPPEENRWCPFHWTLAALTW